MRYRKMLSFSEIRQQIANLNLINHYLETNSYIYDEDKPYWYLWKDGDQWVVTAERPSVKYYSHQNREKLETIVEYFGEEFVMENMFGE